MEVKARWRRLVTISPSHRHRVRSTIVFLTSILLPREAMTPKIDNCLIVIAGDNINYRFWGRASRRWSCTAAPARPPTHILAKPPTAKAAWHYRAKPLSELECHPAKPLDKHHLAKPPFAAKEPSRRSRESPKESGLLPLSLAFRDFRCLGTLAEAFTLLGRKPAGASPSRLSLLSEATHQRKAAVHFRAQPLPELECHPAKLFRK